MVLDAVAEFVNVVIGNGCTKLNLKKTQVTAEPPEIMMREMLQTILPEEAVTIRMKTARGDFLVIFFFAAVPGLLTEE